MATDCLQNIIKKGIVADKKTNAGMYVFLYKIGCLYYWFYEDDVEYKCSAATSIKKAIQNIKNKSNEREDTFTIIHTLANNKKGVVA